MLIAVVASIGIVSLGLALTLWGLRPPRRGDTPYCAKCGYNLTGRDLRAPGARCSECGLPLDAPGTVVLGERRRRPWLAGGGVAALLVGVLSLMSLIVGAARGVDWYQYQPTWLVIRDVRSGDVRRARDELQRRRIAGELSAGQISAWADAALDQQAALPLGDQGLAKVLDALGQLLVGDQMSPAQRERCYRQMLPQATLSLRPRVAAGDDVWYRLDYETRVPANAGVFVGLRRTGIEVDGRGVPMPGNSTAASGAGRHGWGSSFACPERGRHRVRMTWTVGAYLPGSAPDGDKPDWSQPLTLEGETEVLEASRGDLIKLTRSAKLDERVQDAVTIGDLTWRPPDADGMRWVDLTLNVVSPMPIGLAFEAVLESPEGRTVLGHPGFSPHSGGSGDHGCGVICQVPATVDPQKITILLYPSTQAASKTVDLYEIWGGGLRFAGLAGDAQPDESWRRRTPISAELFDVPATQPAEGE